MNPAQVHLALNHFPIIGLLFTLFVFTYGLMVRSEVTQKISLYLLVLVALISLPVYLSGEAAEEIIEDFPEISHEVIHNHEEAAEFAFYLVEAVGVLSLLGLLLLNKDRFSYNMRYALLILGIITFILMVRVGSLGGKIMHPELSETPAVLHEDDQD